MNNEDRLVDEVRDVIAGLQRRADECAKLLDGKDPAAVIRLCAKRAAYGHAAELLEDALTRASSFHTEGSK